MPPKKGKGRPQDWDWVEDVVKAEDITLEHRRRAAGLHSGPPPCPLLLKAKRQKTADSGDSEVSQGQNGRKCTARACKSSPRCYNHLGLQAWLDETTREEEYTKATEASKPVFRDTTPGAKNWRPAGLKNFGATCYANAFIQVWYHNIAFRNGVYAASGAKQDAVYHLASVFSRLQHSVQPIVDPEPLIEALGLNKTNQQDAAEFSKLFASLLHDAFQQHHSSTIKSLLTDQFQGMLEYSTRCRRCGYTSKRESPYYEIDISLKDKASLECRIRDMSSPEELSGDNRYSCPQCDCLVDAVRTTRIKSTPPILQFALMRFVYDTQTWARKKSRASISYPEMLNINGTEYALRGVVTHHGTSATSGHFTCDVYNDDDDKWYHISDEEAIIIADRPAKRPRILDDLDAKSSKDAYMLVYHRTRCGVAAAQPPPNIKQHIDTENALMLAEVAQWNADADKRAETHRALVAQKEDMASKLIGDDKVLPKSFVAKWVASNDNKPVWEDVTKLVCPHGGLAPDLNEDLLLVSEKVLDLCGESLSPAQTKALDICTKCVALEWDQRRADAKEDDFRETLLELNSHEPRDHIISKTWWQHLIHGSSEDTDDPITTTPVEFICEHGDWWPVPSDVFKVSEAALDFMREGNKAPHEARHESHPKCTQCLAAHNDIQRLEAEWKSQSREDRILRLKNLNQFHVFNETNYYIPAKFDEKWEEYATEFGGRPRFDLDLCPHGLMGLDLQMDKATIINEPGWMALCRLYQHDPNECVSVQVTSDKASGTRFNVSSQSVDVCEECRTKRRLDWQSLDLVIVKDEKALPSDISTGTVTTTGRRITTRSRASQLTVLISKSMTLQELKLAIMKELDLLPLQQRLIFHGEELRDGSEEKTTTMESLGVMEGEHMNIVEILDVDDYDFGGVGNEGFGGTALVGRKACSACTYSNDPGRTLCEMCETPL